MKIISKETLDEIIRLTKKYNKTGDVDILPKKHEKAFQLSKEAFGKGKMTRHNGLVLPQLVSKRTKTDIELKKGVIDRHC